MGAGDVDLLSGRLPNLWSEAAGLPSDQRPAASRHDGPALPGAVAHDRPGLALRLRGRGLRRPSAARRIGRLALRAKRFAQRAVLCADARGLRRIRPAAVVAHSMSGVSGDARLLRPGADVEADRGDAPLRASIVGLLAAGASVHRSCCQAACGFAGVAAVASDRRKDPVAAADDRFLRNRALGARESRHLAGENPAVGADRQRPGLVHRLPGRDRSGRRIWPSSIRIRSTLCRCGNRRSRC